ncbi:MAG: hypothetical protein WAX57_05450, partial [Minisyncoccia bacterium]
AKTCAPRNMWYHMLNPNVSVTYNARVVNATTGAVVQCGASVPYGTRLKFEFIPHKFADIVWFGTGTSMDSPYGDWVARGARPAGNLCVPKNLLGAVGGGKSGGNGYVALSMNPPTKTLTGVAGSCTTAADGVSKVCTMDTSGVQQARFNYAQTEGQFHAALDFTYASYSVPDGCIYGWEMRNIHACTQPFKHVVPAQVIPCTVTVGAKPAGSDDPGETTSRNSPSAPTLTTPSTCVASQAFSITMTSTDPQGDRIRYAVDWNSDGSIDAYTNYVNSGAPGTLTRVFSAAQTQNVRAYTEDIDGNLSPLSQRSVTCSAAAAILGDDEAPLPTDDMSYRDTEPDLSLRATPSLVSSGARSQIHWSATNVEACRVSASNGDSWDGITSPVGGRTTSEIMAQTIYTLTCQSNQGVKVKTAVVNTLPSWRER